MYLKLDPSLKDALPLSKDSERFDWFLRTQGIPHREVKNRLTYEIRLGGLHFFVKRHLACGWKEVFKEWYRLRKPVVSARTEWEGAEILDAAGLRVPRVLGKGERGNYPNGIESFVVLEALEDCETLEFFRTGWLGVEGTRWVALKRAIIAEVASMCRKLHACGINHRDLYINHFLISRKQITHWQSGQLLELHLIDLHRVQKRKIVPNRWLEKDIGSLLFSALNAGLTSTDYIRFLRVYLGAHWRDELTNDQSRWRNILNRSLRMYSGFHQKAPTLPKLLRSILIDE